MKINRIILNRLTAIALCLLVFFPGCDDNFSDRRFDENFEFMQIYDYVKSREDLSIYKSISDYSGFYSNISTVGTYTVFVPTNDAFTELFAKLGISSYEEKTPEFWMYYMRYHALDWKCNSNTMESGPMQDPVMMGKEYFLTIDVTSYIAIKINNLATIREYNIELKNGYVHVIDKVLAPPISTTYDLLVAHGGYTKMLALFEANGMKGYLTDSVATVLIEPDEVLNDPTTGINTDTISNMKEWLEYHILPKERSFLSNLDGRCVQPLYPKDLITFNFDPEGTTMYCNRIFSLNRTERYNVDQLALNGIYHSMGVPLQIIEHSPGIVRFNLYGRTNDRKGYKQSVFAEAPATISETTGVDSYHQGQKPPMCYFAPIQAGDAFTVKLGDVVEGTYMVRMVYYNSPRLTMSFNGQVISRNIAMDIKDGDFPEMTTLKYKDCGNIVISAADRVDEDADGVKDGFELRFQVATSGYAYMDIIELRPVVW